MGVYGHTPRKPHHPGVVMFAFVDDKGEVVRKNRVYTKNDAALCYDALRAKYPEYDALVLHVWVKRELLYEEQRGVVAKGLDRQKPQSPPGEPFTESLAWRGPRPKVKAPGRLLEVRGEGEVPEKLGRVLSAFAGGGAKWRRAEGRPWETTIGKPVTRG